MDSDFTSSKQINVNTVPSGGVTSREFILFSWNTLESLYLEHLFVQYILLYWDSNKDTFDSCFSFGAELCLQKVYVDAMTPPPHTGRIPQNVTIVGNEVIKEMVKLKLGH